MGSLAGLEHGVEVVALHKLGGTEVQYVGVDAALAQACGERDQLASAAGTQIAYTVKAGAACPMLMMFTVHAFVVLG